MKNKLTTTKSKLRLILFLIAVFSIRLNAQPGTFQDRVPIEESMYGNNVWNLDLTNGMNAFYAMLPKIKEAGIRWCRIGGIEFSYRPLHSITSPNMVNAGNVGQLKLVIDTLRSIGVQVIIQVGYNPICGSIPPLGNLARDTQVVISSRFVRALNSVLSVPVKYWSIANEPDLPNKACNNVDPGGFSYNQTSHYDTVAKYFRKFSFAMKSADTSIKIMGPDFAMFGVDSFYSVNKMMRRLLSNPSHTYSLLGAITSGPATGKYYTDILSFHYYLDSATVPNTINGSADIFKSKLESTGTLERGLINMIKTSGSGRNIGNIRLACTEINIDLKNKIDESTGTNYTDSIIKGFDNRSFRAAQWVCDVYRNAFAMSDSLPGKPRKSWLQFFNMWSLKEGNCKDGLGILSGCTSWDGRKRPTYHAISLLTEHFKGTYYRGFVTSTYTNTIKTFASVEKHGWKILVVNYDSVPRHFRVNVDGSNGTTGTHPLTLNFHLNYDPLLQGNALSAPPFLSVNSGTLTNALPANSIVILTFFCDGSLVHRIDYTLQDAIDLVGAKITQIGGNVVNASMIACGLPGGIGGTISSNTSYSSPTFPVVVSSDITLAAGVSLSFTNSIILMNEGTQITGNRGNKIILKNSIIVGCGFSQWKGISLIGVGAGGNETLISDSSIVLNATKPFYLNNVENVLITKTFMDHGDTAITLENSRGFTISENFIGSFQTGIATSNSNGDYPALIHNNLFTDIDYPMHFNNDGHQQLSITCNDLRFRQIGILSESTILQNQGTATTGAGNRFKKTLWDDPSDYLFHTGNSPVYNYGPAEASLFPYPGVMNISSNSVTNDRDCQLLASLVPCEPWILGVKENKKITDLFLTVFPNPSTGEFSVQLENGKGEYIMNIYDLMGKLVASKKVDFGAEKTVKFDLKAKGLYILTLQNESGTINKKVVVH